MVSCDRCGWEFRSMRMGLETSCPRCRLRDDVSVPLKAVSDREIEPGFLELITEAAERLHGEQVTPPAS